jgi:hypothetical protein
MLNIAEGFAEALDIKSKEKKDATFRKQSYRYFECPKPFQTLLVAQ